MTEDDVHSLHSTARCEYAWCATLHGETVHPDDEAHRSVGVAFAARVRAVDEAGAGAFTDIEVGILRRLDDDEDWLVVEVADGGFALSREAVRELRRVLVEDPQVRDAFFL